MTTRRHQWPAVPLVPESLEEAALPGDGWMVEAEPQSVPCKHGFTDCQVCGATDRRDRPHSTRGGDGAVGRLRRRRR